ncbi:MAG: MFS transporter, partial [Planctomycetota bacterium]
MTSSPSTIGERTAAHNAMARRATIASTMGSALEWIDFTAYGALSATVFPKLFFPSLAPGASLLAAFATFGVGFFARPLGGLFFGMLGDRLGRKKVLLYTLVLMGLASFLIGCLPAYSSIGVAAPTLLVTLRFLQGFALGGEATGAQLMTMEHAPPHRRGLYGSFINLGSSVSAAVANGLIFGLIAVMGSEAFESWGWRLPFLMSVVLVFLGLYIRLRVSETPAFAQAEREHTVERIPILEAFREYPRPILRLLLLWCAPCACFYVINVFT